MKEQVCLLTDDVFTAWCLWLGAGCAVFMLGTLLEAVYARGYESGRESVRSQLHRAGFEVMREVSQNKYAASVAWRVVRRVFGA